MVMLVGLVVRPGVGLVHFFTVVLFCWGFGYWFGELGWVWLVGWLVCA